MLMCSEDNGLEALVKSLLHCKLSIWLWAHHSRWDHKSEVHSFYISNLNTANKTDPALGYIQRSVASLPLSSLPSWEVITLLSLALKRLHQECCAQLWALQMRRVGRKVERLLRWSGAKSTREDWGIWACLVWWRAEGGPNLSLQLLLRYLRRWECQALCGSVRQYSKGNNNVLQLGKFRLDTRRSSSVLGAFQD